MKGWLIYDAEGRRRNAWFIDRLIESAGNLGAELTLVEAEMLRFGIVSGEAAFFPEGKETALPDFAIVRTIFPLLSRTLESAGVKVFNSARIAEICNDKRLTHAFFARVGIPTADTYFTRKSVFAPDAYDYPLIIKSASGHGGREVFLARSGEEASKAAAAISSEDLLLQKMQTPGADVRVYLLAGRILAAVRRTSGSDFRSNFSLGGNAELTEPFDEMIRTVETVDRLLSPTFVGVDFIFDREGKPLLNEIEDIVGARMLYTLTDLPVHDLFIRTVVASL